MQTEFSPDQLADPDIAAADQVLRACVHCGFCTATCPTYVLHGDELEGPRGRIYLIKNMLESGAPPTGEVVKHIDSCLSCLACMTTCPSGVHYQHLVDIARARIEETYRRPLGDRVMRAVIAAVLPHVPRFRIALRLARIARPVRFVLPGRWRRLVDMAPVRLPPPSALDGPRIFPAEGARRRRVVLAAGCVQRTLAPTINDATIRLLTRHGCDVVVAGGAGCCGALTHHLGRTGDALASARANITAWLAEAENDGGVDAIVVNASGCGTQVKDYGFMLRDDPQWADRAARVSALARDISELMVEIGLAVPASGAPAHSRRVAYQSACSLQHGQKIDAQPVTLLEAAGFSVSRLPEAHLCCGSAGSYNLLHPATSDRLRDRKVGHIEQLAPDIVATGNIGCQVQIGGATSIPVVHTVELLDWATGGPRPPALGIGE